MSNKNRIPCDGGGNQKKSPISSASTYDVGDTTVVISMTPTFIGSRTPPNFTRRTSVSSKISKTALSAAGAVPASTIFKSSKSKFTSTASNHECIAPGSSNIINIAKQQIPKIEVGPKMKARNFKSVSVESTRLLNPPLRSSHLERGVNENALKKDSSNLSRSASKISLRSAVSSSGRVNKIETPRWIQGVLVKDIGIQTTEPFNSSNFTFSPQPIKASDSSFDARNEDESYLLSLLETPNVDGLDDKRCPGPNAECLMANEYIDGEELSDPLHYLGTSSAQIDDESITIRTAKRVIQPTAVRIGTNRQCPKTPLSERSASVHLEDGSSSVSSFSTLVSNITSPDTSKMVKRLISNDISAFKSLHYSKDSYLPFAQFVPPIRGVRHLK